MLVGCAVLEPAWRAVVVALVMAVLSPVMAELGAGGNEGEGSPPMSDEATMEPTAEQLAAIEAGPEGAPDDFEAEGGEEL